MATSSRASQFEPPNLDKPKSVDNEANDKSSRQQQQVSRPSETADNPQPLQAPRNHHPIEEAVVEQNEQLSDVGFAQKNGVIVPVGPNDMNDSLPMPYEYRDRNVAVNSRVIEDNKINEDESAKQVLPEPNKDIKVSVKSSSQNVPIVMDGNLENPQIEN